MTSRLVNLSPGLLRIKCNANGLGLPPKPPAAFIPGAASLIPRRPRRPARKAWASFARRKATLILGRHRARGPMALPDIFVLRSLRPENVLLLWSDSWFARRVFYARSDPRRVGARLGYNTYYTQGLLPITTPSGTWGVTPPGLNIPAHDGMPSRTWGGRDAGPCSLGPTCTYKPRAAGSRDARITPVVAE